MDRINLEEIVDVGDVVTETRGLLEVGLADVGQDKYIGAGLDHED